jgi:hypothetical protein
VGHGAGGRETGATPGTPVAAAAAGAARQWLAVAGLALRFDARRPASWIAAASCLAVGGLLIAMPFAASLPLAIACGGLGAVAAAGAVGAGDGARGLRWLGWPCGGEERSVWAVAGALAAAVACRSTVPIALAGAAALTAVAMNVARRRGFGPADVASIALGISLATAGLVVFVPGGVRGVVASTCWLVAVALLAWWPRSHGIEDVAMVGGRTEGAAVGAPLTWPAMVSTLAAMAVCYFLAPEYAVGYAVVVAGWFLCLAAPAATIAAGGDDAASRTLLVASAPGRPALPGTSAHVLAVVATHAAILAWPAAVAAALWGATALRPDGPLAALGVLAVLAAVTAAGGVVAARRGHGDTALAIIAALAMIGATACLFRASTGTVRPPAPLGSDTASRALV